MWAYSRSARYLPSPPSPSTLLQPAQTFSRRPRKEHIGKPPQRIDVWYLIARFHSIETQERAAVHYFRHRCHIRQIIHVLHQTDLLHMFLIIVIVVLSLVQLYKLDPLPPRKLVLYLIQELVFPCPHRIGSLLSADRPTCLSITFIIALSLILFVRYCLKGMPLVFMEKHFKIITTAYCIMEKDNL